MEFDKNQTIFESADQKKIWKVGRKILPFDITSVYITDPEMLEGCKQIYEFTMEWYGNMFANPEIYKTNRNCYLSSEHFWHLIRTNANVSMSGNDWVVKDKNNHITAPSFFSVYDPLVRHGLTYEIIDKNTAVFRNEKYPLLLKYYKMFIEKCAKHPTGGYTFVYFCDFRIFKKGYKISLEDATLYRSDKDRNTFSLLENYLKERGCNFSVDNFLCINVTYKNENIMGIGIFPYKAEGDLSRVMINLNNKTNNGIDEYIIKRIEESPDKDEMINFIQRNINCCNACGGKKHYTKRCGRWTDVFGRRLMLCGYYLAKRIKKNIETIEYTDYDMEMFKRVIEMRIDKIDIADLV